MGWAIMFRSQVWALALNVWREAVRDQLLYILTGSGVFLLLTSLVLGEMFIGDRERVVINTGFWVLGMWGLIAVLYLGSNIVKREITNHTVYLVLSRPVSRTVFLIGKYTGMLLVLLSTFGLLASVFLVLISMGPLPITRQHLLAFSFILGEWFLLAAFSLFFASFTSPLLHNFFLVGLAFLGHWSNDLRIFAQNVETVWIKRLLEITYYILPNLEALNFREAALLSRQIPAPLIIEGALVLLGWIMIALIAGIFLFARRGRL